MLGVRYCLLGPPSLMGRGAEITVKAILAALGLCVWRSERPFDVRGAIPYHINQVIYIIFAIVSLRVLRFQSCCNADTTFLTCRARCHSSETGCQVCSPVNLDSACMIVAMSTCMASPVLVCNTYSEILPSRWVCFFAWSFVFNVRTDVHLE